jgi:phosphatidylserine synthase
VHPRNACTYGALLAGWFAVVSAHESASWHFPGALLALGVVLDTFDGRFARRFATDMDHSAFGVELDSLADAVVFGLAPVVCMYLILDFEGSTTARLWWSGAAFAYLVSALTRLGCYNLHQTTEDHFLGIPTTLAGLLLSTLFLFRPSVPITAIVLAGCAIAMLAPIVVPRPRAVGLWVFVGWIALVFTLHGFALAREQRGEHRTSCVGPPACAASCPVVFQHAGISHGSAEVIR